MATKVTPQQRIFTRRAQALRGLAFELRRPDGPLQQPALVLVAAIKEELSHPGSGRTYKSRGVTSRLRRGAAQRIHGVQGPLRRRDQAQLHQASAPGEPPAPDIGELRRTIGHEIWDNVVRVGSPLPQSVALDRGHVFPTHVLLPRPFMEPALAKARPQMTSALVLALRGREEVLINFRD